MWERNDVGQHIGFFEEIDEQIYYTTTKQIYLCKVRESAITVQKNKARTGKLINSV